MRGFNQTVTVSPPMRVVYLNPIGEMGGAEVALLTLLTSLKEAKPDWDLHLVVAAEGPFAKKARSHGINTHMLLFSPAVMRLGDASSGGPAGNTVRRLKLLSQMLWASFGIALYAVRLRKLLRELQPDIIHTNGFKMHLVGAIAKRADVPLIWHVHDYVHPRPVMARLMRFFRRRPAMILANSNSVRDDLLATCGNEARIQTLYNAVDTDVFSPDGPTLDLDSLAGLPHATAGTIKVGMLATFARWKGHESFLRAISMAGPDHSLRAYVIGGAVYQTNGSQYSLNELRAEADRLGVSDRVGFTNFVDEPAAALRALDIVVHASTKPEPFGLVVAEALACERAVIASEAGGVNEIIRDEANALSHSPGDAAQLAQQILLLAGNRELRQRLATTGRGDIQARFNRDRLIDELGPIYLRLAPGAKEIKSSEQSLVSPTHEKALRSNGPERVRGLDSLRFVCAMWVVFVHCGFLPFFQSVDKTTLVGKVTAVLSNNAFNGSAAVIVFFVISGFCINFPYSQGRTLSLKSYFSRRYIRIIIPMVAAILLARPLNIQFYLLSDSILWSLLAEEIYYVLYPILLATSRQIGWKKILAVSFVLSLGVILTNPVAGDYPSYGPYLNWLLGLPCWLLGCLLAQHVNSAPAPSVSVARIWSWRFMAWGLSSFCSFLRFHSPLRHPWTLNLFAVFVYFWLVNEIAFYRQHQASNTLEKAGKWSYSLYLLHLHGQAIFFLLAFAPFTANLNWMVKIAFILLVSYAFYLTIEKPSHFMARRIARKLLRPVSAPAQTGFSEAAP